MIKLTTTSEDATNGRISEEKTPTAASNIEINFIEKRLFGKENNVSIMELN